MIVVFDNKITNTVFEEQNIKNWKEIANHPIYIQLQLKCGPRHILTDALVSREFSSPQIKTKSLIFPNQAPVPRKSLLCHNSIIF
jgi:hypothetical protein